MRRDETISRRSMSARVAQLLRAIASNPLRPRTVLKAGHSKTALSVNSAAYVRGSRARYAWTRRPFTESIPTPLADEAGGACEHVTPRRRSETRQTPMVRALFDAMVNDVEEKAPGHRRRVSHRA